MDINSVVVNSSDFHSSNLSSFFGSNPSSFPGRGEYNLFFNVDIVNLLLKNNGGKTEGFILLFLQFRKL